MPGAHEPGVPAMPFVCPDCNELSLAIHYSYDYPGGDDTWDELAIQVVGCSHCGMRSAAVYQESRRGASETVVHNGFRIPRDALVALEHAIAARQPKAYTAYITAPDGTRYDSFPVLLQSELQT